MLLSKIRTSFRITKALAGILAIAIAGIFLSYAPIQAQANGFTPIILTQGDYSYTIDGITYTVRHDYAHPYYQYTNAYNGFDRMLVVNMQITNHSGRPFGYTGLAFCADANGKQLVNSNQLAAAEFGTVENGKTAEVTYIFLLRKGENIMNYTYQYNHMDYSMEYLSEMAQYMNGMIPLSTVQQHHPSQLITFHMQNPGY